MGCVTVGPGRLGRDFLFDGECCFDVKEEMHLRNEQEDPGCLLLSRFHYNCPPEKGLNEAIHSPDFLKSPGSKISTTYPWKVPRAFHQQLMKEFLSLGGLGKFGVSSQGMWAKSLTGRSERPNPSKPELDSGRIVDIISMLKLFVHITIT